MVTSSRDVSTNDSWAPCGVNDAQGPQLSRGSACWSKMAPSTGTYGRQRASHAVKFDATRWLSSSWALGSGRSRRLWRIPGVETSKFRLRTRQCQDARRSEQSMVSTQHADCRVLPWSWNGQWWPVGSIDHGSDRGRGDSVAVQVE